MDPSGPLSQYQHSRLSNMWMKLIYRKVKTETLPDAVLAQHVEQHPVHRGCVLAAAAPGWSAGLGPSAACHSPSLILFPVTSSAVLSIKAKS